MMKLAVGVRDIAHLRHIQAARARAEPPLRHRTRLAPRRAAEITDGGSMFWVIAGAMVVRQRILDVRPDVWEDGAACAGLFLDPALVAVEGRPVKPFQGWRYLEASAAPPDVVHDDAGGQAWPASLRAELRALGLI